MINNIDDYLLKLKKQLLGCDPDIVRDSLSDSEEHLREALRNAREMDPGRSESKLLQKIIKDYGTPDEVASTYKVIEARKDAAGNKKRITIGMAVFISTLFTSVCFLCQGIFLLFFRNYQWDGFGCMVRNDSFLIWALGCLLLPIPLGVFASHVWKNYRKREKDLPLITYLVPVFPFFGQGIILLCLWVINKSEWFGYETALLMGILSLSLAFIMLLTWIPVWKNRSLPKGV